MDLEWFFLLKDGGFKIIGYIVEYKEEGKEEWERVVKVFNKEMYSECGLSSYFDIYLFLFMF